ncbi:23S rRNA pseudouridine(1911/1915/1917) synthase RluD [Dongshaea marina]|uniref:23S rRNA pseudouridine(1911/1915/1917) synthase RluD n=1 Tax=Dongshaea marina TaxID=2047966 RepID=UPI000D3E6FE2|nr:23S rRNA pseudouridine(1911/1915/1917) synthase RluD [Dongshaea marina]
MSQQIQLTGEIQPQHHGQRLDQVLADLFSDYSRSRIKSWIQDGVVHLDGSPINKPREKVTVGQVVTIDVTIEDEGRWEPQPIELDVVYEDDQLIVINKPAGLVVHPGAGTPDGTVLNGLLHRYPELSDVPRAGIVHRLDKDTTGLMVVARTIISQTALVAALQDRLITREYEAVAIGHITAGGSVDEPIGRHSRKRTCMAVTPFGKPAVTHYRIAEHFRAHTYLRLRLESGRTHQIRVHMAHLRHPLVGDPLYGGRLQLPTHSSEELTQTLRGFKRQALHATMLQLKHPVTGEMMQWNAETPQDMVHLLDVLREDKELNRDQIDWL